MSAVTIITVGSIATIHTIENHEAGRFAYKSVICKNSQNTYQVSWWCDAMGQKYEVVSTESLRCAYDTAVALRDEFNSGKFDSLYNNDRVDIFVNTPRIFGDVEVYKIGLVE